MVFWKTYPFREILKCTFNDYTFRDLVFTKSQLNIPNGLEDGILNVNNLKLITELKQFLKMYFGQPPSKPILDIPENELLGEKDHILYLRKLDNGQIVGCIRYHYIGIFVSSNNQKIYSVDCFCIHPDWRKKGIGDYLLTKLHNYANNLKIPYTLFLKEGYSLNIIHQPYYSSIYVFRKPCPNINSPNVKTLTINEAYKMMDIFRELNPNIFIIRNIESKNQIWKLYKYEMYKILVCFQNTYQSFEEDGQIKKIGWITSWIESPNITDKYREDASKCLSDSMNDKYDYIWANKEWVGHSKEWKDDGPFNWYLYQWTTCLNIKRSYCILN